MDRRICGKSSKPNQSFDAYNRDSDDRDLSLLLVPVSFFVAGFWRVALACSFSAGFCSSSGIILKASRRNFSAIIVFVRRFALVDKKNVRQIRKKAKTRKVFAFCFCKVKSIQNENRLRFSFRHRNFERSRRAL
jgi:hypothetical protein